MTRALASLLTAAAFLACAPFAEAQDGQETLIGPCGFSLARLSFRGEPRDQAACLLRTVGPHGVIAASPARLPAVLGDRVGWRFDIDRPTLSAGFRAIGAGALVDSLDRPVSRARDNDPAAPPARYFVIHDTSSPYLKDGPFPPHMDALAAINDVSPYAGPNAVAHAFVKRTGEIVWGHDLSVPWRATKFESKIVGLPAKGLFINIENVQPRRFDPSGPPGNDWIAPEPGLTAAQYDRLALLYIYASARAGTWLIPAFHADLDEGLRDAHDDPQNFEMDAFTAALARHLDGFRRAQSQDPAKPA